jgi:protein phosphatase
LAGLRSYQEDSVLAERLPDGRVLLAVADGMGGHAAGEVASAIALEALRECVERGDGLRKAFTLANERVYREAEAPGRRGMGTTLVAAVIDGDRCEIANVGDSRGYLITEREIRRVTTDHSFVAEAMARGKSELEAMASPYKEYLTRAIGIEPSVDTDVYGPMVLGARAVLLLCSDGLHKSLADIELREIYLQSNGPGSAVRALASAALVAGSDDNVSVVVAELGELPRTGNAGGTVPLEYDPPPDDAAPPGVADAAAEPALLDVAGVAPGAPVAALPSGVMAAVGLLALAVVAVLLFGLGWGIVLSIVLLALGVYLLTRR